MNSGIYVVEFDGDAPFSVKGINYGVGSLIMDDQFWEVDEGEKFDEEFFYYNLTNLLEGEVDVKIDFADFVHRDVRDHGSVNVDFTIAPPVYESSVCFRYA